MSIKQSMNFLLTVMHDDNFRMQLNELSVDDFYECIKENGFEFTPEEFEESVNMMHVKCQFEEDAMKLFETVAWYQILTSEN